MKLNHINLTSIDVPADRAMFETFFGLTCSVMRGRTLAVLHDDQGMVFVLNDFSGKRGDFAYPHDSDVHHIGFIQDSREEVDAINARLRADGWDVPPPRDYHGAWTFYFKAKGRYFVEVATQTRLRSAGKAGINSRPSFRLDEAEGSFHGSHCGPKPLGLSFNYPVLSLRRP